MRLTDYISFDAERFLKDLRTKGARERAKLESDLNQLSELPAIENASGIKSGETSDMTANMALKIHDIKAALADIEECERAYSILMSELDADDRAVINGFFACYLEPNKRHEPIWKYIHKVEAEEYMGKTKAYKNRRETLEKAAEIIADKYQIEIIVNYPK